MRFGHDAVVIMMELSVIKGGVCDVGGGREGGRGSGRGGRGYRGSIKSHTVYL